MKAQPSIKQYPVAIFKLAAVFFVLLPLLVTSVIFYIGRSNNRTYVEIWTLFIELELTMHLYNLGCIAIAVVLWKFTFNHYTTENLLSCLEHSHYFGHSKT